MSNPPSDTMEATQAASITSKDISKYIYLGASILLLLLMLLGFQQFYLHGRAFPNRPLAPPIRGLIILHGVAMTLWILLLVVQSALVRNRKLKIHMTLGKAGAVLAVIIFLSGLKLAIESARVAPPEVMIWGLTMKQFMNVPLVTILLFGGFVLVGIMKRKKPAIHRPMMLMASIAAVGAAVDRTPMISSLYNANILGQVFGPTSFAVLFGLMLLILQTALTRKFDRYFASALAITAVAGTVFFQIAPTPAWDAVANFLLNI